MSDQLAADPPTPSSPQDESPVHDPGPVALAIGLGLAAIIGWCCLQFIPEFYALPERLTAGSVSNSPTLQAEASALNAVNERKNAMVSLGFVAAAFGVLPLVCCLNGLTRRVAIGLPVGVATGIGCGVIAALAAFAIRDLWTADAAELPDLQPSMYADISIVAVQSLFVAAPASLVFLLSKTTQKIQKSVSVVLAGLVTGLLLPVVGSIVFPRVKNDTIPPQDTLLSLTWLIALAVLIFLFTTMTNEKKRAATTRDSSSS
jgi:hypothetical protein